MFRLGLNEESWRPLLPFVFGPGARWHRATPLLASLRAPTTKSVWSLLTNHSSNKIGNAATNTLHANILMV